VVANTRFRKCALRCLHFFTIRFIPDLR